VSAPVEDLLAQLDEAIHPECDSGDCHLLATHVARIHQLDHCNDERYDADGAQVLLLCVHCLAAVAVRIVDDLTRRIPAGWRVECLTCGRPVACLHDLLEAEKI
jgi:hypothetical protein